MKRTLVFDTSPLIILAKLNILEKVVSFFEDVYIPTAVFEEALQKQNVASQKIQLLVNTGKIKVLACRNQFVFNTKIQRWELEVII